MPVYGEIESYFYVKRLAQQYGRLPGCYSVNKDLYTTTCDPMMTKWLCLPGTSLQIEECTQYDASSDLSDTLRESYGHDETDSGLPHLWVIFVPIPVLVPVSVPAFPCFPVAGQVQPS